MQRKALHAALLGAFPNEQDFERLLLLELEVQLGDITTPAPWPTRLLHVIRWAEDQSRLDQLVAAAKAAQPDSPDLRAYFARWPSTPPRLGLASSFALPTDEDQLERLIRFAIPWFAVTGFSGFVLVRDPSETMLLVMMTGLLVLAVVSVARQSRG